jgi:hypothetical protein
MTVGKEHVFPRRMTAFAPPLDYPRIKVVRSFQELVTTPFARGVNALCWPRTLPGDFGEVVEHLGSGEGSPRLTTNNSEASR